MDENWNYYEIQKIKKHLFPTYVQPNRFFMAELWCYNNIGPFWYYIPENIFDPILGSQYDLFWTARGNFFYFKDPQLAASFRAAALKNFPR
jgi:hypothetical protein